MSNSNPFRGTSSLSDEHPDDAEIAAPTWVTPFYAELLLTGSVSAAAAAAGIRPAVAWALRRAAPDFAAFWDKSVDVYRSGALVDLVADRGRRDTLQ